MRALLLLIIILLGTTFVYGQEGTILISTGEGNSYDVARKNALRYAIEKVYGAFVSSNSLLSNDILQKDEIYTFSTGVVSNMKEVSKVEIGGSYSVTLEVLISTEKIVAFIRNEGKDIKYDAQGFASNIKALALNEKIAEESERNIINSMFNYADVVFKNSLDYKLGTSEPINSPWGWSVNLDLSIISNNNIYQLQEHISKTLKALDYNYTYELNTNKGFTIPNDWNIWDVIKGSPASLAGIENGQKIISYSVGNKSQLNKINKRTNRENVNKEIDNAYQKDIPIYLKVEDRGFYPRKLWESDTLVMVFKTKQWIIEILPSKYSTRVKRNNAYERRKIGLDVYPIKYNGYNLLLRSEESRRAIFNFFSNKLWQYINSYKVMVILENSSREIKISPISFDGDWRGYKPKNEGFSNKYESINSLNLEKFSGISLSEKNIYFGSFNALFKCSLTYSGSTYENLETTLDFISSIKEFKVIKP